MATNGQEVDLTGFLFGNVDEHGNLENKEIFDDPDLKHHLPSLNVLGLGPLTNELTEESQSYLGEQPPEVQHDVNEKAAFAIDYSDITEVADDYDEPADEEDDYDAPLSATSSLSATLMPPPTWIPTHSPTKAASGQSPSHHEAKIRTPLANLLPPELVDANVQEMFPEFKPGKVLRFSRLFKAAHKYPLWRKKRTKDESEGATVDEPVKDEPVKGEDAKDVKPKDGVEVEKKEEEAEKEEPVPEPERPSETTETKAAGDNAGADDLVIPCPIELEYSSPPQEDQMEEDDCVKFLQDSFESTQAESGGQQAEKKVADWRYGPASVWYDVLNVPANGEGFDYGFKLKNADEDGNNEEASESKPRVELPHEAYLMVSQHPWEDDVILNGDEVRHQVTQQAKRKGAVAGWIPSNHCRSLTVYWQTTYGKVPDFLQNPRNPSGVPMLTGGDGNDNYKPIVEKWKSIFPAENEDLLYKRWEDNVIFDHQAMDRILTPTIVTLDPNDENIILKVPDEMREDDEDMKKDEASVPKEKKESKKAKILLGKAGIIQKEEDDELESSSDESQSEEPETIQNKDSFNMSNDEFYNPRLATDSALKTNLGGTIIQHSTPAMELRQPYFPTHMGPMKMRNFYRTPLKRYSYGPMAQAGLTPVLPLEKVIKKKAKMREQERLASGGGDMFFMRTTEDLTARDGDLILAEYSEEFPPLLMQVGMATRIKNFYKRKPGQDTDVPTFKYGELAFAHTSPFLGAMAPGQCIQAFENNMFRAPVYHHEMPVSDFLIIRTRQHFFVRPVKDIFVVGQECPLLEVPSPNSKKANNFVRDFLQVYIYRLFLKSKDEPKRIKMEEVKKAFPSHSESSIRKRLKLCADFKRTGTDSNWWVIKPEFRLPTEEEIRAMVVPEQTCAYYSMLVAEQRLKDAGYGEKSMFAIEEDKDDDTEVKMDDEIRAAPWNTTRAYIQAMKGKCLLQLTGVADPTGCGEGFSYVKVPNKPSQNKDDQNVSQPKRTVTGTDADLRRLSLKDARAMLRKFNVSEVDIKKLSRWEVIDCVRTMSTQQAKAGEEGEALWKFARGNRYSAAEHQERYKEECQRIFDLQNRILGSSEVLSTDDEDTEEEDSDLEEMGKNIESLLSSKKTSLQLSYEKEEEERRELQKMIHEGASKRKKEEVKKQEQSIPNGIRKLKITRTFLNENGQEYTRAEVVRKPPVIDVYVKLRQSKDEAFIRQFAALDDSKKEEMRKERRRIQEQLRRIKKNQEKLKDKPLSLSSKKKKKKDIHLKETNRLCGACGQVGHMRTNKECPLYAKTEEELNYQKRGRKPLHLPSVQVALTEEQEEEMSKRSIDDRELVHVEGTKMKLSKELVKMADKVKKETLTLKIPKKIPDPSKARRRGAPVQYDYLVKPNRHTHRRRADPMVTLSSIYENIVNEMRDCPGHNTALFQKPVDGKKVPDYYNIIDTPMDLQTIKQNIRDKKYETRESFLMDVTLLVRNSERYNGVQTMLSETARTMLEICVQRLAEKEDKLMKLEKAINPLLDDDELVGFSYILEQVVEKMKRVENAYYFHKPVNRKAVKDYYDVIQKPVCVEQIEKNLRERRYKSRDEFMSDVRLLHSNSLQFNGADSAFTRVAQKMVEVAGEELSQQQSVLKSYEESIQVAQQAALEAADSESVLTANSFGTELDTPDIAEPVAKKARKVGRPRKSDSPTKSQAKGLARGKPPKKLPGVKGKRGRKPKKLLPARELASAPLFAPDIPLFAPAPTPGSLFTPEISLEESFTSTSAAEDMPAAQFEELDASFENQTTMHSMDTKDAPEYGPSSPHYGGLSEDLELSNSSDDEDFVDIM